MYIQLIRAIKWNIASIILYKTVLFIHHAFLFAALEQTKYGMMGTVFSTIYFFIPVSNFGFDYSLLSFFKKNRSPERTHFVLTVYKHRTVITLIMCALMSCMYYYQQSLHLAPTLFFTCLALFFTESMKHSVLTHAHIFNLSKKIALCENAALLAYVSTVWGYIFFYNQTPFLLFFLPLAVTSAVETIAIGYFLHAAYQKLPESADQNAPSVRAFYRESFFNYINQLAKALFSPNFLILLLALTVGFHKTGYIKFITTIVIFLYSVFFRSVQMSAGALLAGISHMPTALIQKTFNTITTYYAHVLITISVYFAALLYFYSQTKMIAESADFLSTHTIIIFFCCISFLEYGTLTYETLFITQKQGKELAWINAANIAAATVILPLLYWFPNPLFLFCLCVFKISTVVYIVYRARHIWDIDLSVYIQPEIIIVHLAIALALVNCFL